MLLIFFSFLHVNDLFCDHDLVVFFLAIFIVKNLGYVSVMFMLVFGCAIMPARGWRRWTVRSVFWPCDNKAHVQKLLEECRPSIVFPFWLFSEFAGLFVRQHQMLVQGNKVGRETCQELILIAGVWSKHLQNGMGGGFLSDPSLMLQWVLYILW